MRWTSKPLQDDQVSALSQSLGSSRILATLLIRLGISDPDAARAFLHPRLRPLDDPFSITNLRSAVDRIRQAIDGGEKMVVLGDYDVDGVTSTALLISILRRLGAKQPGFIVPRRLEEGYGLSRIAIDRVLEEEDIDLFIAVDCGTNSVEEVAYLRAKGIDVIIIDHHRSKEEIPEDAILINPHVLDRPDQPWVDLCTVGLVFKVAHGLLKVLRAEEDPSAYQIVLKDYLDLVAMGTIADLVPLRDENRILCKYGLRVIQEGRRPGVNALLKVSGVKQGEEVVPMDISFRIGPRINASGRLADASLPVEMLLNDNPAFCEESAQLLEEFNRERQEIERQITIEAKRQREIHVPDAMGVVLFNEEWHAGVVGIVASRISRKYHRPTIVLASEDGVAQGSGRSVSGINLVEILRECDDLLESWGGHPLAVGVSLPQENVADFQIRFDELVREASKNIPLEPEIEVAAWLELSEVNEDLLADLDLLHPFGQGHREPIFAVKDVVLQTPVEVFMERHFRFRIVDQNRRRLFGVAWQKAERIPPIGEPIDVLIRVYWNYFNNRKSLQLEMIDWRPSGPSRELPPPMAMESLVNK